jgi:hypothetical protein
MQLKTTRTTCLGRQVLEGGVVLGFDTIIVYFILFYIYFIYLCMLLLYTTYFGGSSSMYASASVGVRFSVAA